MSAGTAHIGFWIDHTHNSVIGATITLTTKWGGLLTTTLALLVTFAGSAVWTILAFTLYQARIGPAARDASFFQEQVILRNASSSSVNAWELIKIRWKWYRRTQKVRGCAWLLIVVPLAVFLGFSAASIFVAKVAGKPFDVTSVLLKSQNCGFIRAYNIDLQSSLALVGKVANDSRTSSAYVDNCYHASPGRSGCTSLPVQKLPSSANYQAPCPFAELGRCLLGENAAVQLDSGYLDSNDHFGINAPVKDRVKYRMVNTCAILHAKDRLLVLPDFQSANDTFSRLEFYFGPIVESPSSPITNYTYAYLTRNANSSIPYTML